MTTTFEELETKLANELKEQCEENGCEINPTKSAQILYKLGLMYKKKGPEDMITLIQCAALLNAAITRKPENVLGIQLEMQALCSHVLKVAGAKQKDSNLVKKSNEIKEAITEMRRKVIVALETVKPIPSTACGKQLEKLEREKVLTIQDIQNQITSEYKSIMESISDYCVKLMGDLPCDFAQVGMGSLARSEITPYSDFENVIVLEEGCQIDHDYYTKKILPYFKWYSVIFQLVLLNLQETIVPSVNITALNDPSKEGGDWFFDAFTTRGISFDGMMPHACKSPLGRQQHTQLKPWKTELIKPVSEMLEYLETEQDFKNGYHLSDILTKTCYVYGKKTIYEKFSKCVVKALLAGGEKMKKEQVVSQIKEDIGSFSTKLCLSTNENDKQFNFKRIVYRSTTLFISALGRLHDVVENSCFEILECLKIKNVLNHFTAQKLEYSVAVACETRLRLYMKSKGQKDFIEKYIDDENTEHVLVKAVGESSCISYFQIAYALQFFLCRELNIKRTHFCSYLSLINISICEFLGLNCKAETLLISAVQKFSADLTFPDFELCLKELERELSNEKKTEGKEALNKKSYLSKGDQYLMLLNKLYKAEYYNDAVLIGKTRLLSWISSTDSVQEYKDRADALFKTAEAIRKIGRSDEALAYYELYITFASNLFSEKDFCSNFTNKLEKMGLCLEESGKCKKILVGKEKLFETSIAKDIEDRLLANTLNNIGLCFSDTSRYNEAMICFKKSIQIYERTPPDNDFDRGLADTYNNIGLCVMEEPNYEKAIFNFEKGLKIYEHTSIDQNSDRSLCFSYNNIGLCLMDIFQHEKAIFYFEKCLKIEESISSDKDTDRNLAETYNNIGLYLMDTNEHEKAMFFFNKCLKIEESTSLDQDIDTSLAQTHNNIGLRLMDIEKYKEAMEHLEICLKIEQRASSNQEADVSLGDTYNNIGLCFFAMNQYENAISYLEKCLRIQELTSCNKDTDKNLADTYNNIARILKRTNQHEDAFVNYEKSRKIKERIFPGAREISKFEYFFGKDV